MDLIRERGRQLRQLTSLLERGIVDEGDADEMLALSRNALGLSSLALVQGRSFDGWNRDLGIPDSWRDLHVRYQHQDPSTVLLEQLPPGRWYLNDRDMPAETRDTDLSHHFYDQRLRDVGVVKLYSPFVDDLFLVIYRCEGQRPFSADDQLLFTLLYPHFAGGLAARRALGAVGISTAVGTTATVAISYPSRRFEWTEPALDVWRRRLGAGALSGQGRQRIERALLRATDRFASPMGGRSQEILPGFFVEVAHVPPQPGETHRLQLVLWLDEDQPSPPLTPAEELLSPTQVTIARGIAGGRSAGDMARELGVSQATVRTHLQDIYRRLGVTRSELAAVVRARRKPAR